MVDLKGGGEGLEGQQTNPANGGVRQRGRKM